MMPSVKEFIIKSDDQLINFIYGNKIDNEDIGRRIFRGHSDSSWSLIPSLLRGKSSFMPLDLTACNDVEVVVREMGHILNFVTTANESGIHWPGDEELINFRGLTPNKFWKDGWPNEKYLEIISMMQHYGIPTRLLDWTFKPEVALYFAVSGWLSAVNKAEYISIWALDYYIPSDFSDYFEFYIPPYYRNGNIKKQHGVFTYSKIKVSKKNTPDLSGLEKIINDIDVKKEKDELLLEMNKEEIDKTRIYKLKKRIEKLEITDLLLKVKIDCNLCKNAYQILGNNRSKAESIYDGLAGVKQRILDDILLTQD